MTRDTSTNGSSQPDGRRNNPGGARPDGGAAAVVRGGDDGRASWALNSLVIDRVTAADTDGAYSVTEHRAHPSYATPYHRHDGEDEALYVLSGEFAVTTDDGTRRAGPGATVVLPRGRPHALRVAGDEPASALVFCSPAGFEEFFHEVGEPAAERRIPDPAEPDVEAVAELAPAYDLEVQGPPPAPE